MTDGDDAGQSWEKYDQTFFLDLAAKGKDEWNKWRRDPANKDVHVTFAGVVFSEAPRNRINFEGFEFGDYADFSNCTWGFKLEGWLRGPRVFASVFQPGRAFFPGAAFGQGASFNRASFGDWADFYGVTFEHDACFIGAAFGENANLTRVTFGMSADFTGAAFGNGASFSGAAFLLTKFNQAHFKGWVTFSGQSQEQWSASRFPAASQLAGIVRGGSL